MRRSSVRFRQAAPPNPHVTALHRPNHDAATRRQHLILSPVLSPSLFAAVHTLSSIMCPYRSIVIAADACPATR